MQFASYTSNRCSYTASFIADCAPYGGKMLKDFGKRGLVFTNFASPYQSVQPKFFKQIIEFLNLWLPARYNLWPQICLPSQLCFPLCLSTHCKDWKKSFKDSQNIATANFQSKYGVDSPPPGIFHHPPLEYLAQLDSKLENSCWSIFGLIPGWGKPCT